MGIAIAAGAAALVGGIGKIIGGRKKAKAKIKAARKMITALKGLDKMDPTQLKEMAIAGDKAAYIRQFEFARQQNPELAQIRDSAVSQMTEEFGGRGAMPKLWTSINEGFSQVGETAAARSKLEQTFLSQAQKELDLGSKLSPEFQAELIRSGLETGARSGVGASREGPLAQLLGNKIGSAQIELEGVRQQRAMAMAQSADAMQSNRSNILAGMTNNLVGAANLTTGGMNLFNSMLTPIGLGGTDAIRLEEARRAESNEILMQMAKAQGAKAVAKAEKSAGTIEGATGLVSNMIGGLMGSSGSLGGTGLGQIGSMIGGLFGKGAQPTTAPQVSQWNPTGPFMSQGSYSFPSLGSGQSIWGGF